MEEIISLHVMSKTHICNNGLDAIWDVAISEQSSFDLFFILSLYAEWNVQWNSNTICIYLTEIFSHIQSCQATIRDPSNEKVPFYFLVRQSDSSYNHRRLIAQCNCSLSLSLETRSRPLNYNEDPLHIYPYISTTLLGRPKRTIISYIFRSECPYIIFLCYIH